MLSVMTGPGRVHRHICRGYTGAVDAGLPRYDSIPHGELLKSVARGVVDGNVLRLIKMWLKAPVEERDEDGTRRMSGGKGNTCATPQGAAASPLLPNIYMNRFLKHAGPSESAKAKPRGGLTRTRPETSERRGLAHSKAQIGNFGGFRERQHQVMSRLGGFETSLLNLFCAAHIGYIGHPEGNPLSQSRLGERSGLHR
jgi:hypothetical protein